VQVEQQLRLDTFFKFRLTKDFKEGADARASAWGAAGLRRTRPDRAAWAAAGLGSGLSRLDRSQSRELATAMRQTMRGTKLLDQQEKQADRGVSDSLTELIVGQDEQPAKQGDRDSPSR
jgi:hypothetical protein